MKQILYLLSFFISVGVYAQKSDTLYVQVAIQAGGSLVLSKTYKNYTPDSHFIDYRGLPVKTSNFGVSASFVMGHYGLYFGIESRVSQIIPSVFSKAVHTNYPDYADLSNQPTLFYDNEFYLGFLYEYRSKYWGVQKRLMFGSTYIQAQAGIHNLVLKKRGENQYITFNYLFNNRYNAVHIIPSISIILFPRYIINLFGTFSFYRTVLQGNYLVEKQITGQNIERYNAELTINEPHLYFEGGMMLHFKTK